MPQPSMGPMLCLIFFSFNSRKLSMFRCREENAISRGKRLKIMERSRVSNGMSSQNRQEGMESKCRKVSFGKEGIFSEV